MGFRLLSWFKFSVDQAAIYGERIREASVTDHPGPRRRETLGAAPCLLHQTRRFLGRTAAAAGAVRGLVFAKGLWRVGAALVGGVGLALVGGHAEERGRRQDHPRRSAIAW